MGLLYWFYYRLPRLWMNRTAYAFWIKSEREKARVALLAAQKDQPL